MMFRSATLLSVFSLAAVASLLVAEKEAAAQAAWWIDADAITGLSNGQAVNTWNDQSGNNNHATGNGMPTYTTGVLNGKPIVRFDGVNDYFNVPDNNALDVVNHSFFGVFRFNSTSDEQGAIIAKMPAANDDYSVRYQVSNTNGRVNSIARNAPEIVNVTGTADVRNQFVVYTGVLDTAQTGGAQQKLFSNGVADPFTFNGSTAGSVGAGITNAADLVIGLNFDNTRFFDGDVAEMILFDFALSAQDVLDVNAYLGEKWGINVAQGGDAARGLELVAGPQLAAVPEPNSIALWAILGLGLTGSVIWRLRRRKGS